MARYASREPGLLPVPNLSRNELASRATRRDPERTVSTESRPASPYRHGSSHRAIAGLELIESAQTDLIIMSFASFRIPDADAALSRTADRGVRLYLILESEEDSCGRYRQYGASAFSTLAHNSRVSYYCWPKEKRPRGALLHAKAVVDDGSSALITSANLTEHAIDVNIEIGALIRGEPVPKRLRNHLLSATPSHGTARSLSFKLCGRSARTRRRATFATLSIHKRRTSARSDRWTSRRFRNVGWAKIRSSSPVGIRFIGLSKPGGIPIK